MSNRVLIYSFPFFMIAMEWVLRKSLGVNSVEFVGPTIAAAALGLLLPLTGIKDRDFALSEATRNQLNAIRAVIIPNREYVLIHVVWFIVFISLATWSCCLVFACKPEHNPFNINPVYYALGNYFIAVFFSEIREAI